MNIEQTMMNSAEVRDCLKNAKYSEGSDNARAITAAETCFKNALGSKSKEEIQSLSDKLGLQDFNLVQGRTTKEITQYLSDRLYKAMKGVDRDEEKFINFRDSRRKMTDQRDFYDLYKTQLTKTSLFEINRFCFLDLRLTNPTNQNANNFSDYWVSYFQNPDQNWTVDKFTDSGSPAFGSASGSPDKNEIYRSMSQALGENQSIFSSSPGQKAPLGKFFETCLSMIKPLCELYEANPSTTTIGKKACLTKERIRYLEKAIAANQRLGENWDSMGQEKGFQIADISFYDRGRSDPRNSIDSLTNASSADFLNTDNVAGDSSQLLEECENNPELDKCEQFYLEGNFKETKHNIELKATLKNQLEIAQVKRLNENRQDLKEYLKNQGYYEIYDMVKQNENIPIEQLTDKLEKMFEARKKAMVSEINDKLSNRQLRSETSAPSPTTAGSPPSDPNRSALEENVKAVKSERERLAQVILFNNIISSHISLSKVEGGTTTEIGRNLNILKSEVQGQEVANIEVQGELFENLRTQANEGSGGSTENFDSIDVGSLFSKIIGDRPDS